MSTLPPSSASRRMACAGSYNMELKYPASESESGREGNAAHWLIANYIRTGELLVAGDPVPPYLGQMVTDEMIEGLDLFTNTLEKFLEFPYLEGGVHIEQRIKINDIHPDCEGVVDGWAFQNNTLDVFDYKFGHTYVDVFENWQLIAYAGGLLQLIEPNDSTRVRLHIIQPRNYSREGSVRTWVLSIEELKNYFKRLCDNEQTALQPSAPCTPSPECKFCSARHACGALQRAALSVVDIANTTGPHDLTPAQTGNELRILHNAAKLLDARITGLEEQALGLLAQGKRVPFYTTEKTAGSKVWSVTAEELKALELLSGVHISKPDSFITPLQAIKAGIDAELVNSQYSKVLEGKRKLVSENINKIAIAFSGSKE